MSEDEKTRDYSTKRYQSIADMDIRFRRGWRLHSRDHKHGRGDKVTDLYQQFKI